MTEPDVVYGQDPFGSGWLFLLQNDAMAEAAICDAYGRSETWGEFRTLAGEDEYAAVMERFFEDAAPLTFDEFASRVRADEPGVSGAELRERFVDALWDRERRPLPEEPFEMPDDEGAWAFRHMTALCWWVPEEIQKTFGRTHGSDWNYLGEWDLEGDAADIVAAFEDQGYDCRPDQDLVDRAFSW